MPLVNPVEIFKQNPDIFDMFLRSLSTLHSTGVIEMLREHGRVKTIPETSSNYVAAQAQQAAWSAGYNRALDELVYFRQLYLDAPNVTQPTSPSFGSLRRAQESGDLTEEEVYAIRNDQPIPVLERQSIPATTYIVRPDNGSSSADSTSEPGSSK